MTPAPKRRWLRWSLRTLFVVATIVCVWLGYEMNWIRQRRAIVEDFFKWHAIEGVPNTNLPPVDAPGLLWLFAERGYPVLFVTIVVDDSVDTSDDASMPETAKAEVRHAKALFPEARFWPQMIRWSEGGAEHEGVLDRARKRRYSADAD